MKNHERIPFRIFQLECCGHMLCTVNPRFPSYCPQCGTQIYPAVKSWMTLEDNHATLTFSTPDP